MTHNEFLKGGLAMTHEVEVLDDDGFQQNIKYFLEPAFDENDNVTTVFVSTDWTYSFSFNVSDQDTPKSMLELAEELIKDAWDNEDF